jgi:DNA-binding SARP family transcriptional activator/tetratricopeptide (TPR) repeat protein
MVLEFRVLGPLEVVRSGVCLPFRGSRERALLALLVLNANRTVSAERLAEELWSGSPPEGAIRSLRVYVSRLRQTLGDADQVVVTRPAGYLLQVDPETVDALRFEALVVRGREEVEAGDHGAAAATLREALALWRGPALADVADVPSARSEAARLEEARLASLEDRIEADLACGRHRQLTAELEALTREHPFRENLWAQRIIVLYRTDRQADALRAFQDLRQTLGEELGIEPSEGLRRLENAVLRHDPQLDWRPADRPAGTEPEAPGSAPGGVVTFLFTDLVGSTELLGELGEEAAEEVRQSHFGVLRAAIDVHGGEEVKSLGDGLMVVFSSPLGALRAAVAMQQAVATERPSGSRPLQVRIGLHAGEPMRDEDDYYGTPVVVAKRLCDQAMGGQILASGLVCDLVGRRGGHGFGFRHLGFLSLKGLPDPVPACEVVSGSASPVASWGERVEPRPLPLPLGREERVSLVGRDAEVARLEAVWRAATGGKRRLVLVGGEPGIGKSSLMSHFARRTHSEGALVLFGRCEEGMGVPYQPFVEALTRYLRDSPAPVLGRLPGELVRLVPEVAERIPGLPLPLRSDPETERYRLFEAVAAWLGALSAATPVLFVIDDLHWATKPTLLLLSHVARSDELSTLLLVAAYRDTPLDVTGDLADAVVELLRHVGVERVSLSGLDTAGVAAFMEAQARHQLDEDGWALARVLHAETAGNPFFVREMLRHLAEKGALVQEEGRWVAGQPVAEIDVPESVREVVGRRLTRLPEKTCEILAIAAVLGERFELPVLAAASEEAPSEILGALDPALKARLVDETTVSRYHFAHALVRSTLEEALGPTRRAQLHLRAAEAIESLFAGRPEGQAAALAAHYLQAGPLAPPERTIDALTRAGEQALVQFANDEAAIYYRQALKAREMAGGPPDAQQSELMIALGEAQRRAGDPAHRETLLEAGRLAHQAGDAGLVASAALANRRGLFTRVGTVDEERAAALETALEVVGRSDSPERARLLAALASELHFAHDERRVELGREGLAVARRLGDAPTLAEAIMALWLAILGPTTADERARLARELAGIAREISDPVLEFHTGFVRFLTGSEQGDMAAADQGLMTCIRIAEELGQPVLRWRAAYLQAHRAFVDGRFDDVERWTKQAVQLGEAAGQPDAGFLADIPIVRILQGRSEEAVELMRPLAERFGASAIYPALLAWACAEAGRIEEAHATVARIRATTFAALRRDYLWLATIAVLGRACARSQDRPAAEELYDVLRPYHPAIVSVQTVWFGPVAYDLGLLATSLGRYTDADAHFAEAVKIHDHIGVRGMLAHTCLEWARMLLVRPGAADEERTRELLKRAVVTARDFGLRNLEQLASTLLQDLP